MASTAPVNSSKDYPGRATVKAESCGHTYDEEVGNEAVLAYTTEPDTNFHGVLDIYTNTSHMAIC